MTLPRPRGRQDWGARVRGKMESGRGEGPQKEGRKMEEKTPAQWNGGEPAFCAQGAYSSLGDFQNGWPGLTKREYFAVHAPAKEIEDNGPNTLRECAAYLGISESEYAKDGASHYRSIVADLRSKWADALLEALAKGAAK